MHGKYVHCTYLVFCRILFLRSVNLFFTFITGCGRGVCSLWRPLSQDLHLHGHCPRRQQWLLQDLHRHRGQPHHPRLLYLLVNNPAVLGDGQTCRWQSATPSHWQRSSALKPKQSANIRCEGNTHCRHHWRLSCLWLLSVPLDNLLMVNICLLRCWSFGFALVLHSFR